MFNLYANETPNGIMTLLGSNSSKDNSKENSRIISSFAVLSLLILSVIANGSQAQTSFELQQVLASAQTSIF